VRGKLAVHAPERRTHRAPRARCWPRSNNDPMPTFSIKRLRTKPMISADDLRALVQQFKERQATDAQQRRHETDEARKREADALAAQRLERARLEALAAAMREAAKKGQHELLALRFPSEACSDGGRAIDVGEEGWPETLQGQAADLHRFWNDEWRPQGIRLRAAVLDWPDGMIGDIGLFLAWG
jgi:hypothetical protein